MLKKMIEETEILHKHFEIIAEDPIGTKIDEWSRAFNLSKVYGYLWLFPCILFISSFYLLIRLFEILVKIYDIRHTSKR